MDSNEAILKTSQFYPLIFVSNNKIVHFPGPIGSQLNSVESRTPNKRFRPVTDFEPVEFHDEVYEKLSCDQKYLVKMAQIHWTGIIPENLQEYGIGLMHMARWNNTASRILRLNMSVISELDRATKANLKLIVNFILGKFEIKSLYCL